MTQSPKYQRPGFLPSEVNQQVYERWLRGRSAAHFRRDRRRGNSTSTGEEYRLAIHRAVLESNGTDFFTGEQLNWSLIGRYRNAESKALRRQYKTGFSLLPTVDHVGDGSGPADFKVCAWRTNEPKSDLSADEFLERCRRVVSHGGNLC